MPDGITSGPTFTTTSANLPIPCPTNSTTPCDWSVPVEREYMGAPTLAPRFPNRDRVTHLACRWCRRVAPVRWEEETP